MSYGTMYSPIGDMDIDVTSDVVAEVTWHLLDRVSRLLFVPFWNWATTMGHLTAHCISTQIETPLHNPSYKPKINSSHLLELSIQPTRYTKFIIQFTRILVQLWCKNSAQIWDQISRIVPTV